MRGGLLQEDPVNVVFQVAATYIYIYTYEGGGYLSFVSLACICCEGAWGPWGLSWPEKFMCIYIYIYIYIQAMSLNSLTVDDGQMHVASENIET